LKETNLSKPYIVYSFAVALGHQVQIVPELEPEGEEEQDTDLDLDQTEANLILLSEALELDDDDVEDSPFKSFVEACNERTNVKSQRETRAGWFLRALREDLADL
jgi:hypothetical protein